MARFTTRLKKKILFFDVNFLNTISTIAQWAERGTEVFEEGESIVVGHHDRENRQPLFVWRSPVHPFVVPLEVRYADGVPRGGGQPLVEHK